MAWNVVILGGGFGGLYAARKLERALPPHAAKATIVTDVNFMLYTPLLPGAAAGTLEPRHVVVPSREHLDRTDLGASDGPQGPARRHVHGQPVRVRKLGPRQPSGLGRRGPLEGRRRPYLLSRRAAATVRRGAAFRAATLPHRGTSECLRRRRRASGTGRAPSAPDRPPPATAPPRRSRSLRAVDLRARWSSGARAARSCVGRLLPPRERERRVSRLTARHRDTSPGGSYGTPRAGAAAKGARTQAECPQGVPFRTQHPLGVVVNRPSVWPDR
jgi:hypothetical protein